MKTTSLRSLIASTPILLMTVWGTADVMAMTTVQVNSLDALRNYADADDTLVRLAPGTYDLNGDYDHDGTGDSRIFLNLTGSNTTFDFTDVTFRVSTRDLRGYGGGNTNGVNIIGVFGDNLTVQGFEIDTYKPSVTNFTSDSETIAVKIGGSHNTVRDASITTGGSWPFGYGDAFGKGAPPSGANQRPDGVPFITHHKSSGILVRDGSYTTIDNVDIQMKSLGHGIYMQHTDNVTILNSTVTGELASSNDIISHPLYDDFIDPDTGLYGVTTYGEPIPPDIYISKSEDGIRVYGTEGDGVGVTNVHVENVVVTNMREAFSLFAADGVKTVINSEAWDCEYGFEPGSDTTIINSRGNATNGPLLNYRRANITHSDIELELVQDKPQTSPWDIAYISGYDNNINLSSSGDSLMDSGSTIRIAQRFNDWRHDQRSIDEASSAGGLSLMNTTGQNIMLGNNTMSNGVYVVAEGALLGGSDLISTASGQPIEFRSESRLDPVNILGFDVGSSSVSLAEAIDNDQSGALLYSLSTPDTSDGVMIFGGLEIGTRHLGLEDFLFTTEDALLPGTYTLLEATHGIDGSLNGNRTGKLNGLDITLQLASDALSIELIVNPMFGDANADGIVDLLDLSILARNFMGTDTPYTFAQGDFTGDGEVTLLDLSFLAYNFNKSSTSTPEPASALLLALATTTLRRTRTC